MHKVTLKESKKRNEVGLAPFGKLSKECLDLDLDKRRPKIGGQVIFSLNIPPLLRPLL